MIRKLQSAAMLQKTMRDYFQRLHHACSAKEKKVAWCTSVGPVELLYSFGFEIHFPENHAAILGASKIAEKYIPASVAMGYSPEVCSYMTSDIGAYLKHETPLTQYEFTTIPTPDVLVYNTNQCHEVQDWFSFYAKEFDAPLLGIQTPLSVDEITPEIIEYIVKQYKNLIPPLEKICGQRFDIDKFKECVRLSHDACASWGQALKTAQHRPAPVNFFDASIHMGPVVVMRGTQSAVDYYKLLLEELNQRIVDKIGAVENERHRIYWDGMPVWFKLSNLAKLFAKLDACIVASTYCNSWAFDDLDPADPFGSSALAYTKLFIVRSARIKEMVMEKFWQDYAIDGVIYHEAKTCPRNSNNRLCLQARLHNRTKLPYLEIQGDLNDARCFNEEQSTIAIETFINQLCMVK